MVTSPARSPLSFAARVPVREPVFIDHVEFRPSEFQVLVDGARAGLTIREFQILEVLAERHDRVVQRPEVYDLVWGGQMPTRDRSVDVFVRKVRRKLAAVSPDWTYVHTHFGVGYRFAPERVLSVAEPVADVAPA